MGSDRYRLHKTVGNICEFLRQQCAEYYNDAEKAGLELTVDIPDEPILLEADYRLLSRAFGNLLENAGKYNRTGKNIFVSVAKTAEYTIIEIADDGAPVQPEIRNVLFDAFARGDQARKTDGGTGLGLSIAKAIIEKHNGQIAYEYRAGKNVFSITLF